MTRNKPIGIFDSGYGGLTVFRDIVKLLPEFDYIYLGDNARAPYGNRSLATVYEYTWEAIQWLFRQGCPLIIVACNTASAKALRSIQQLNLPNTYPDRRVLGVIRPTAEVIGDYSSSGKLGILATTGTVNSESYLIEISHFFPDLQVYQQACPLWVPFIEDYMRHGDDLDSIIRRDLAELFAQDTQIDTILLACTHYPLILDRIKAALPPHINIIVQGTIVAESLENYLHRHPEIKSQLSTTGSRLFYTTDDVADFNAHATLFYGEPVHSAHIHFTTN
jgi:glutamate racemase